MIEHWYKELHVDIYKDDRQKGTKVNYFRPLVGMVVENYIRSKMLEGKNVVQKDHTEGHDLDVDWISEYSLIEIHYLGVTFP